jgi:M6 family metalloprotease-like protein
MSPIVKRPSAAKKPPISDKPLVARKPSVSVTIPRGEMFVGSFHRLAVKVPAKLSFDDLVFVIPDGPKAGLVSPSRDRLFAPRKPHIMLLVGYEPGTYVLRVLHRVTDDVLFEGKFTVNALWRDQDAGPSLWFTGIVGTPVAGAAWGGGGAGPQNVDVVPASGTRRIAVLLFDTASQRFTTDEPTLQGHRDRWMDELIDGVTVDGQTRSVKSYFQEVSYNNFDIEAEVFGPVSLPGEWSDYFQMDSGGNWAPGGSIWQSCVTAGDSLIDYDDFDTLVCVSQQVDGPPVQRAWPYANGAAVTSGDGNQSLGVISMPNEWGVSGDREIHDTFSHELGHNLGLGDQYRPDVGDRNPGAWEMMHSDNPLPHFSIAHRMMLGWIESSWVQSLDFSALGGSVDQTFTLHPTELGDPPAGRTSGVEIRLSDGWNYYFEYRRGQTGQIGDQALPEDSVVLGTDVVSAPYSPPFARPAILLLPPDTDSEGAALSNGENYRETDFSDPTFPTDFRVDVSGIDGDKADLRVRYGVLAKPDPSIRPWPAGPDRQWQSPDIEVKNERNQEDPDSWFNVPWAGNPNTIEAKVRNAGTMAAPQVRVNFGVKNYNIGGVPESPIGSDVKDIAAGATETFTAPWTPPGEGHFCVTVRIPLYQTPATPPAVSVVEMTELNNLAQTNYNRFISADASPPSREVTKLEVGNPYQQRTRVFVQAGHSNPLYRTYVEHTWLMLDPGETRDVTVMFEYAPDNLTNKVFPPEKVKQYRKLKKVPNKVAMLSRLEDPGDEPRHKVDIMGGAQAEIVTGRKTRFERFRTQSGRVSGSVVTVAGDSPAAGKVIVRLHDPAESREPFVFQTVKLVKGAFAITMKHKAKAVDAYFMPAPGFGDCWSKKINLVKRPS